MDNPTQATKPATFENARERIRQHPVCAWTACATLSLLSARHLLVEANFHYPLLVYLAQLVVITVAGVGENTLRQQCRESRIDSLRTGIRHPGTLLDVAAAGLTSLSMVCMLQAILHLKNLPTLAMLMIIAMLFDDAIVLILGSATRPRRERIRISLLLLAAVGILATEYRLSVANLITAIPAMLFAGTARALKRIASQHYPDQTINRQDKIWCIVGAGYIIAGIWIIFLWSDVHLVVISLQHIPLLAFNATITAVTLLSGTSLLLPNDEEDAEDPKKSVGSAKPHTSDALTLLTLVGIIGSYSTLSVRRSYTNVFQYVYFSMAVLCIIYNTKHESSNLYKIVSRDDPNSCEIPNDFSSIDEENFSSDERSTRLSTRMKPRNQKMGVVSLLGGIGLFLIWSLYICSNFVTRPSPHPPTSLDTEHIPQFPLEIVISMYREPIEDVAHFISSLEHTQHLSDATVTIYIKDFDADVNHIRQRTGATRVTKLPNIGREGETYLNHITTHWDKLAKHTIFLQADVHNSREFYPRLRNYFDPERTGYLNLGAAETCHCKDCGDRNFWSDNADLFPQYYARVYNTSSSACEDVSMSYKGQFIASAARIRGIDKAIYHDLRQAFVDENSWAHKPDFLRGRPDSMTAPQFGYAMERMWNLVFQCEGMDVAWKCPTMISGWRIGGDEGDCQCFDT